MNKVTYPSVIVLRVIRVCHYRPVCLQAESQLWAWSVYVDMRFTATQAISLALRAPLTGVCELI